MSTTLERLVHYPHAAVFDQSPVDLTVFRLRHPNGATWVIAEAVMTATAGGVSTIYDLSAFTVGTLANALMANGYTITDLSSDFAGLSALVIVEGTGDQGISNGDRVTGYTSLMWVLMGGYAGVIRQAGIAVVQALRQMVITQAEGEWLDVWGGLYNVPRLGSETDAELQARIPKEAFRLRVSVLAIEQAIKDATGYDVIIDEPWKRIFELDRSTLSGPDRMTDSIFYNYHVIQPIGAPGTDWSKVLPVIHRNRAAGIIVYHQKTSIPGAVLTGFYDQAISRTSRTREERISLFFDDRVLLDYSRIEDVPILNHPSRHRKTLKYSSGSKLSDRSWLAAPWADSAWNALIAVIRSSHSRTYRVHYARSAYISQPWPHTTWTGPWTFSTTVRSKHSRLS